ncbi:MAG TPA: hypothetical protein VFE58_12125 [Tepidisphaeraceae bacterium]|jgi:hypothetical protein|nr:hypothetical protein [Tepidisphaeraceae bacterium]
MAKMFYTMDETKAALGKNEEEIKQFAREGRLREFRDGPRLMFKADQVETLKSEIGGGGGDAIDLAGPGGESGAPIGLVDSRGASGSGSAISLVDSSAGGLLGKDDTALAADLSGSLGGVPSPGRGGSTMGGKAATNTGVTVFGNDEVDRADPGAQTAISAGINESGSLESVGSGSGLLDLTRESDDTSLGALALDQTGPGIPSPARPSGRRAATPGETNAAAITTGEDSVVVRTPMGSQPVYREANDEMAPAFAGAAAGASLVMLVGGYVMMCALAGFKPAFLVSLASQSALLLSLYGLGLAVVLFIVGLFLGKAMSR